MAENDPGRVFKLARLAAQIMLESGGEIYRVEETAQRICESFQFGQVDVLAIPTGIFITLETADHHLSTTVKRIKVRNIDLTLVSRVNQISRDISAGNLGLEQAISHLEELQKIHVPFLWQLVAAALSSGFFALLLGGRLFEFAAAACCGLAIQAVRRYLAGNDQFPVLYSLLGGMTAALVALALTALAGLNTLGIVITGAMMPLVPGLAMTHAVRDTMRGDLVSGVTRAAEALLVAISIAVGVGLVLALRLAAFQGVLPDPASGSPDMKSLVLAGIFCFLATLFFAGLFHVPLAAMPVASLIGCAGYLVWLLASRQENATWAAFFLATLLMAVISEIMARLMKMPATVFITTAIIPLVPGIGLYQTMLLIVEKQFVQAADQGFAALSAVGAMALALAVNTLLMRPVSFLIRHLMKNILPDG